MRNVTLITVNIRQSKMAANNQLSYIKELRFNHDVASKARWVWVCVYVKYNV